MSYLNERDVQWCVERMPMELRDFIKNRGKIIAVAGGFIRSCIVNEEVRDIDLFSKSSDDAKEDAKALRDLINGRVIETENACTVLGLRWPVQFIHRWEFPSVHNIVSSFDFTIARAAIWWDGYGWSSDCDRSFYTDLAAKRLVYCNPVRDEEAGGSLLRVLKFYQRGYRIPLDSLSDVITRLISKMPVEQQKGLEPISPWIYQQLREVDPSVDPNHNAHLPAAG